MLQHKQSTSWMSDHQQNVCEFCKISKAMDHVCCMFLAIACSGFTCTLLDKPSRRVLPHGDRRPEPLNGDLDDVAETGRQCFFCDRPIKNVDHSLKYTNVVILQLHGLSYH